ncbi:MAG: hypothetical protein IT443_01760 [Phycisphaeraceae bacterium]|nr:hypothetical protein [Phycisphaeraceae bacterium]
MRTAYWPGNYWSNQHWPGRQWMAVESFGLLTQANSAAFPDRKASGRGLHVTLGQGTAGEYLEHDAGELMARFHSRVMVKPGGLSGGAVVFLRGLDAAGAETFHVKLDAAGQRISAMLAGRGKLSAQLHHGMPWRCVELSLDATTGRAELWLDGCRADQIDGDWFDAATRRFQLGVIGKGVGAMGGLSLDEWAIAENYLGPVTVPPPPPPEGNFAVEPTRWLVVYNRLSADAAAWADDYRLRRRMPLANFVGLALSSLEVISEEEYQVFRQAVADYLQVNGLDQTVLGFVLGHGVPGYVQRADGLKDALASRLAYGGSEPAANALAGVTPLQRPRRENMGAYRLTARIDGPDLASAKSLSDRADGLAEIDAATADFGQIWLDARGASHPTEEAWQDSIVAWASGGGTSGGGGPSGGGGERQRLRLPVNVLTASGASGGGTSGGATSGGGASGGGDEDYSSVRRDSVFWGLGGPLPASGFFAEPNGPRAVCVPLNATAATGGSMRLWNVSSWLGAAMSAGYAAAGVSSRPALADDVPDLGRFLAALRQGWTVSEAWLVSVANPQGAMFLAGDPLATLPIPKDGWDVFGPLENLESFGAASWLAILPRDSRACLVEESWQPPEGQIAHYLVREVDAWGRSEAGTRSVRIARVGGKAVAPPLPAVWPESQGWPVWVEDGQLQLRLVWPGPAGECGVKKVELLRQREEQAAEVITTFYSVAQENWVEAYAQAPTQGSVRFAWRVTGNGGLIWQSFWSQAVTPWETAGVELCEVVKWSGR